jgi:hypothetical protein
MGPPSSLSMILRKKFTMYNLSYTSRTKKKRNKKNNSKWVHFKDLVKHKIPIKKLYSTLVFAHLFWPHTILQETMQPGSQCFSILQKK